MDERTSLRVAVLSSRRAPGLESILDPSAEGAARYRIVGIVASDPDGEAVELAAARGIPFRVNDVESFAAGRGGRPADLELRPAYDRRTLAMLEPFGPEALLLCGYLLIATRPLLSAFPGGILNIHDADLRLRDPSGGPHYPGLRATFDALAAGEPETRSTVHLVTETVDGGPPVAVSRAYPAAPVAEKARQWGAEGMLRAYAYAHREWMMRDCWGRLLHRGLETLAGLTECRRRERTGNRGRRLAAGSAR